MSAFFAGCCVQKVASTENKRKPLSRIQAGCVSLKLSCNLYSFNGNCTMNMRKVGFICRMYFFACTNATLYYIQHVPYALSESLVDDT